MSTVEIRDESDQVHSCLRKFSFALFTLRFVTVFIYLFLICSLYFRYFPLSIFSFIFSYSLFLLYFRCSLSFHSTNFLSLPFFYLYALHFCNYIFHNFPSFPLNFCRFPFIRSFSLNFSSKIVVSTPEPASLIVVVSLCSCLPPTFPFSRS